jgi:hypothetical protein
MEQLGLAITLADGQTLNAQPRPEDEQRLAEVLGDRSTIELASGGDDLEGHAISGDVLVDVEGHAISIRLPNAGDAAALRRALAVGAVTATIVGAGAIAALQPPAPAATTAEQAPAAENVRTVPAPAVRAQQAEQQREQQLQVAVPADADNPAVPAQALRAGQADQQPPAATLDESNPLVPAPALRAQTDED